MITNFKNFKLIKETPDHIDNYKGKRRLEVEDSDAVGFFVETDKEHTKVKKLYTTDPGRYHTSLGSYKSYPARLWLDSKVMTFWVYPNPILFKDIVKHLEKKLNIKILNNGWEVEVHMKDGEIATREVKPDQEYTLGDDRFDTIEFVPVEEYAGSEDTSKEQQIMHLMGWKEKAKMKGFAPGFGSDITAWDQPKNIKYRQKIYQENKKSD